MTARSLLSDLGSHLKGGASLAPVAFNDGTDTGASVDRAGVAGDGPMYSSATVVAIAGASTGTPTSVSVAYSVEDSPDDSVWTAFASDVVTLAAASTAGIGSVDLRGADRYVRISAVTAHVAGTTPTTLHGAAFVFVDEKKIGS